MKARSFGVATDRVELRRFVRFLLVGGVNTLVGYALFCTAVLLGLPDGVALALATVGGVLFNFQTIGRLVFGEAGGRRMVPFVLVYAVQFLVNLAALRALGAAGVGPLAAQAAMLPLLAVGSFLAMRRFVYAAGPAGG